LGLRVLLITLEEVPDDIRLHGTLREINEEVGDGRHHVAAAQAPGVGTMGDDFAK
jgi:hypothetical protein